MVIDILNVPISTLFSWLGRKSRRGQQTRKVGRQSKTKQFPQKLNSICAALFPNYNYL